MAGRHVERRVDGIDGAVLKLRHRLRERLAAVDGVVGADAPRGKAVIGRAAIGQARDVVVDGRLVAGEDGPDCVTDQSAAKVSVGGVGGAGVVSADVISESEFRN